ncbi:MAG: zinc metallopeptidase [Planctomycetota bacterium]
MFTAFLPFFWDPTFLILIPALLVAFWAQTRIKSTYHQYTQVPTRNGATGREIAEYALRESGIYDVQVEVGRGYLSDHYDPRSKKVRLSPENYDGRSVAAAAVAVHEVGHAIQHHQSYTPLNFRHAILPATQIGSMAAFPLAIAGFFFSMPFLIEIGIGLFACVVAFQLVTLPVEFNASSRALAFLGQHQILTEDELRGGRKVLNAAALTYVAAMVVALANLARLLMLLAMSRDD